LFVANRQKPPGDATANPKPNKRESNTEDLRRGMTSETAK